jgi:flavin reductase (DIM6/NTAB) family NADH-FMN oxidoreductase RutF
MDIPAVSALLARLDREIWLVTAQASGAGGIGVPLAGARGGLIATFVSQASIVPEMPRMLVGLANQHHTRELVEQSKAFALHLLGEQHLDWVWRFGLETGRGQDKFHDLRFHPGITGSPVLEDAIGWLDCRVEAQLDSGDRTIYLAEVVQGGVLNSAPPLTMQRLLQLAPADRRTELKHQLQRDSALDATAIRRWREQRVQA